jgi:hypothetical protein
VTTILAIDPGPELSAYVVYDMESRRPVSWGKDANDDVLKVVRLVPASMLAVEMIASYGMAVGQEVFDTCVWIGRFIQARSRTLPTRMVFRQDVKLHVCHDSRAKDTHIRQALIDRYGGRQVAVGTKRFQGPLYGMKGDCWAALAVAITAAET